MVTTNERADETWGRTLSHSADASTSTPLSATESRRSTSPTSDGAANAAPDWIALSLTIATGVFAFVFALEQIYNYDIWWHLRAGQWVVENGSIPTRDPFSFTTRGEAWIHISWLADALLYAGERRLGIDGLIVLKATVIGLSFGGAHHFLVRQGVNPFVAAFALGLAVVIARFRFLLRPQVIMFAGALCVFWLLSGWDRKRKGPLIALPLVMVVWLNLHGSAMLAPVLLACLFAEDTFDWLRQRGGDNGTRDGAPVFLGLMLVALAATTLLTPSGWHLGEWLLPWIGSEIVSQSGSVEEQLPLAWGQYKGFWALMLATGASFLIAGRQTRVFHLLVFAATCWLALRGVRFVGVAAFLQTLILALNLRPAGMRLYSMGFVPSTRRQAIVLVPLLASAAWFGFTATFTPAKVYRWGLGINENRFPVAAVTFLRDIGYSNNLFNTWKFGGYLLWYLPEARTFVDGRALNAQRALMSELRAMGPAEFDGFLEGHDVRASLIDKQSQAYLDFFTASPRWATVYSDDQAVVFLERDLARVLGGRGQAQAFELIRPNTYDLSYLVALATGARAEAAENELRRAVAQDTDSFDWRVQLGFFLEAQERLEALEHYQAAAAANPALAFTHYDLARRAARHAAKVGGFQQAIVILRQAVAFDDDDTELRFLLGIALLKSKQLVEAEQTFLAVLERDPDQLSTLTNLGFVYIDMRRPADAAPRFQRAVELAPRQEGARYGLALALDQLGDPHTKDRWREFLDDFPQSRWAAAARERLQD
jgi:tetratricopeptide (TPR) repeat protein